MTRANALSNPSKTLNKAKIPAAINRSSIFIFVVKLSLWLVCFAGFAIIMANIWQKFQSGLTTTGINFVEPDEPRKLLPCFTIYAFQGFKKKGFYYTSKSYNESTFGLEEMLFNSSYKNVTSPEGNFSVTEVQSLFYGRTYTICYLEKMLARDALDIYLKKDIDIRILFHENGEERIGRDIYFKRPLELSFNSSSSVKMFGGTQVLIREKKYVQFNSKKSPCKDYEDNSGFLECGRQRIRSLLMASINCTIPGLGIFIQSDELNECTDRKSAIHSLTTFLGIKDEFISNNPPHGCVSPCTEVTFNSEVFAFHQNSWIDTDENSDLAKERHILSFSYATLKQEVAIVTLVYDAENFLTSLGGNLGLFLGFSCLSLLISVLKIFVPL